ncbi:23 kDa integral membrane protein [Clonorchis sinensis]|uniref:Tetraspanin n=2 Tax=Clonorchis sinensis TaxID=79923 RepID=A0A8T1MY69_CLOSI|nr:23 kDa integral membrane protein [Clonorchis sinensis]
MVECSCCSYRCLQFFVIVFNAVVMLSGATLIAFGSFILNKLLSYSEEDDMHIMGLIVACIVVGCVLFCIGLAGICGACYNKAGLLEMYALLLVVFILAELGCGIAGGVLAEKIANWISESIQRYVLDYYGKEVYRDFMDMLQTELQCCGSTSAQSYAFVVPASCYSGAGIYAEGCTPVLQKFLQSNLVGILGVAIGFVVLHIITGIFACCFIRELKRGNAVV